jgi:predicted DNA-binding antitoxin AbrB/MazE fold protein
MSEEFQAIYEFGVLRLDKPLALPQQTRVTGVLRNVEERVVEFPGGWAAFLGGV